MLQSRKTITSIVAVGAALLPDPASAQCSVPHTLANGQVADASQVMDNFNTVAGCAEESVKPTGTPQTGSIAVFSSDQTIAGGNLSGT